MIFFIFEVIIQQKIWATYLMETSFLATSKIKQFKNTNMTLKQKFTIRAHKDFYSLQITGLSCEIISKITSVTHI